MGSGGSRSLLPPGKLARMSHPDNQTECCEFGKLQFGVLSRSFDQHLSLYRLLGCYMVKPHGQLVLVSFIHY